ncbi:MAG: hypothetical protein AMS16_03270 [Planctomycetes bacterium DG_58]|nr:MAG: hypothetical protein AMS16_03270 [Planctomycetes bacterium DG_58]
MIVRETRDTISLLSSAVHRQLLIVFIAVSHPSGKDVFRRVLRALCGSSHGVSPAGDRNATQKARARTFVEIHETGHAFELEHDLTENSVMWAPDSNADEPKFQTVPIVFKAADIAVIRETENP